MPSISKPGRILLSLCLALAAAGLAGAAAAQEADAPPPVTLESITVEPDKPGADTLCRLRVQIANQGEKTASQFGFSVRLNGQELAVYGNQLFMYPIDAGASDELQLYNFWTTETSRPMPADGKMVVEVSLREARWFDISLDDEGVEVWQPTGDVPGLPSTRSITLEMTR